MYHTRGKMDAYIADKIFKSYFHLVTLTPVPSVGV